MGKRKRNDNRSFDRLPEEIIHHILSFLSPEKAAQTSVLSKTWLQAWSTNPNLKFNEALFYRRLQTHSGGEISEKRKKKKFVKFVENNLARYSKHNLPIKSFDLVLEVFNSKWASLVNKWLGTALDMGVKELSLHLQRPWMTDALREPRPIYSLPQKLFSAKQLTSFRVSGQRFLIEPIRIILQENQGLCYLMNLVLTDVYLDEQTFRMLCSRCSLIEALSLVRCSGMNCIQVCHLPYNLKKLCVSSGIDRQMAVINGTPSLENQDLLGNLKSLYLSDVYLDEQTFRKLCSMCRLIEDLSLRCCPGLTCIEVSHLPKLKNLHVSSTQHWEMVEITGRPSLGETVQITGTPSLEHVSCYGYRFDSFEITISASQFLQNLELYDTNITDVELGKIIFQCPLLDRLNVDKCNALTRVNITSQTLKRLILNRCKRLVEATIDAPNLLSFWYTSDRIPSVSFISSLLEGFKSVIALYLPCDLDTSSFIRINSLLANLSNCGKFYVNISSASICFNAEDVKEIQLLPQPKVESLIIRSSSPSELYKALLDGLWNYHPETLETPSETYRALLDGLMWSCHPEALETRSLRSRKARAFVSFLCNEVMDWRRLDSCINSEGIMCCRQLYLNQIKVEYLELKDQDEYWEADWEDYSGDWKTLVDGSTFPKSVSELRFTLKW